MDEWMNELGNPSYLILLSTMKKKNLWIFGNYEEGQTGKTKLNNLSCVALEL
jgi:hypothetical protein